MNKIKKGISDKKKQPDAELVTVIKKEKKSDLDIKSLLVGIFGALTVFLTILVIVLLTKKDTNMLYDNGASSMEGTLESSFTEVRLGKEYKDAVADITEAINKVKNNNGYVHVYTDEEEYDTYIYNKHGEAFGVGSDSTNMTVYRNDGTSIQYTDTIAVTEGLDILQLILNSLNAIDNNKVEMYESISEVAETGEYNGYHEYVAVFDSYEDIRGFYSSVSTGYADLMIEDIKSAFHEGVEPTFKIYYMISEGGGLTVACHLVEGETVYLNWYIDGYLNVYDWKLDEEWYTYDFTDADKSEEMLTALSGELEQMLMKYATENEILVTDGSQGASTVDTSSAEGTDVTVTTDENGDITYSYGGELDLSQMPTISLEEAEALLSQSEEVDANIEGLEQLADEHAGHNHE